MNKLNKHMKQPTNDFQTQVFNHCQALAEKDEVFKAKFEAKEKSIQQCETYITKEVEKNRKGQSCVAVRDGEVFGMAVHYYDETNESLGLVEKKVAKKSKKAVVVPKVETKVLPKPKHKKLEPKVLPMSKDKNLNAPIKSKKTIKIEAAGQTSLF